MQRLVAFALVASLTACSTMGSIAKNGQTAAVRAEADDDDATDVANSNNDVNGYTIIFAVGTVALLVAAIAISANNDDDPDPRDTVMPVLPPPEQR